MKFVAPVLKATKKHLHSYILVRLNPISFRILLYSSRVVNEGAFSSSPPPVDPVSPASPEVVVFLHYKDKFFKN